MSFNLPIFPEGSLSGSVVTTVWIGVFVLCLLNLRFGWTLSGLVIPGYLVPLLIVKPLSALVVCGEGVITYLIVYWFAELSIRSGFGSNFFGRDRFFALVLTSIAVRVALDGYLLPYLSNLAMSTWLIQFDLVNNLHSFGLIIVSLIANQFWKPGISRGLTPVVVTVGITYLIVRYPLMHWTNFNIGGFQYMYEDIASSVLASPKAYIILVTTAFIASRLNLYYSWDFNGILIPSLMAIQWYEPLKVLTSFTEGFVIFFVCSYLLKLKWFKETTIEGARKIILFFNVSFAYKMLLGHVLGRLFPGLQVSDCFGFGYLLPSLLAMKMHDKGIPIRITRTTLQASIVGAAVAGVGGFFLTLLPQAWIAKLNTETIASAAEPFESTQKLVERVRDDKVLLYQWQRPGRVASPSPTELDAFSAGLLELRSYLTDRRPEQLQNAKEFLAAARYGVIRVEGRYLYLSEHAPRNGWGTFALDESAPRGMLVEVPSPLDEWATLESGGFFFKLLGARALAIAGSGGRFEDAEGPVALVTRRTFFDAFHRLFAGQDVLQVRGYSVELTRALFGKQPERGSLELPDVPASLWVKSRLPPGLSLSLVKEFVKGLSVEWRNPPFKNIQRDATGSGFAELFLRREDRKRLLGRWSLGRYSPGQEKSPEAMSAIEGGASLGEWLLGLKNTIAPRGTNLYVVPSGESLLFLDEEVLKPIVNLMRASAQRKLSPADVAAEIDTLRGPARALNYDLFLHVDSGSGQQFVVLSESTKSIVRQYWGTYVWRLGAAKPFVLEIPHPDYEENTLEYGVSLFDKLNAACLFMAGSHPKCNTDGSADVVLFENKRSVFNLVHQVALRETDDEPFCAVQVRALGYRPGVGLPDADALLAFSDASSGEATLSDLGKELMALMHKDGVSVRFVDGDRITSGYEVHGSAQTLYLPHTRNKECCSLWLSPFLRSGYRQYSDRSLQEAQFIALGIGTSERDLVSELADASATAPDGAIPPGLPGLLRHYRATQDINSLASVARLWPEIELRRVVEKSSRRVLLVLRGKQGLLPIVMSLSPPLIGREEPADVRLSATPGPEELKRFAESGACFLTWSRDA
jgi:hypothetical protein